jgi:hypothetical protein
MTDWKSCEIAADRVVITMADDSIIDVPVSNCIFYGAAEPALKAKRK